LAAQVKKAPIVGDTGFWLAALNPGRCILGDSQGNTSVFWLIASQPPQPFPGVRRGKEKRTAMKFTTFTKSLVLGAALILASSAFAASKASLSLSNPVLVNGTTVKAGDYKLEWEGSGSDVELSIMQGKKVLAKVPAHVVSLDSVAINSAAITRKSDAGPSTLTGVRFAGKKFALDLGQSTDNMQAGSSK
jgi:hypothetical protein